MKKSAFPAALLVISAGLSGCPIYDQGEYGCVRDSDCASGYQCERDTGSCHAEPESTSCRRPSDCGVNETCSRSATCIIGDCHFDSVGCVQGYECVSVDGRWTCMDEDELGQGGTGTGGAPMGSAGEPSAAGGASAGEGGAG